MPARKKAKKRAKTGRQAAKGRKKAPVRYVVSAARRTQLAKAIRSELDDAGIKGRAPRKALVDEWLPLAVDVERLQKKAAADACTGQELRTLTASRKAIERLRARIGGEDEDQSSDEQIAPLTHDGNRAKFCEARLTVADGEPWQAKGYDWVLREFWAPLDGFKLWPVDPDQVCSSCRARAGEVVRSVYDGEDTRSAKHRKANRRCRGLHAHVIWLTCLQLPRGSGKTANVLGYAASSVFCEDREVFAFIAGSEDQSEDLFRDNFAVPVANSPELAARCRLMRTSLTVPARNSSFEIFATSLAGATGGRATKVVVDEARDVPASVFTALVPQIYGRAGWRCPTGRSGHTRTSGDLMLLDPNTTPGCAVDDRDPHYGTKCSTCGETLQPYMGRVVAMSSAQELDGSSRDWFHRLCEALDEHPEPDAHCYRAIDVINPKVSRTLVHRTQTVLGRVDELADTIEVEAGNVSRAKGSPAISATAMRMLEDRKLTNKAGGTRPSVAFLDTSETNELTSLVILEDASLEGEETWERLEQVHLKVWDPKLLPGKAIDDDDVYAYVDALLPGFALRAFRIDDRGGRVWAVNMLRKMKRKASFRRVTDGCTKWDREARRTGWSKFLENAAAGKTKLFADPRIRVELKAARKHWDIEGRLDVREQSRKVRHLDIVEGVASCHYLAHLLRVKGRGVGAADVAELEARLAADAVRKAMRRRSIAPKFGGL